MKHILVLLITSLLIICCGCTGSGDVSVNTSIVSLPTTATELTANGYRDPSLATSEDSSTSSKASSSKANSSNFYSEDHTYVASKNSEIFHTSTCSSAKRIKEENIIIFEDFEEASTGGFSPCAKCLPAE